MCAARQPSASTASPQPPAPSHQPPATSHRPPAPSHRPPATSHQPPSLSALADEAEGCTRCGLEKHRNKVVFGAGTGAAGLMLIGEGPGADEDRTGIPFVGRSGMILDRIFVAAGLPRETLYITNIVKCRPPRNRNPAAEEIQACRPYLNLQIEALSPRLIVAMGRPAAQSLLRTGQPLSALRGRIHALGGTPLVVTYHPAYLLRSPAQKPGAWADWRRIRDLLAHVATGGAPRIDGEDVPL